MSTTLKPGAISLFESIIMGIAGSAPGFSIATTAAVLLSTAGVVSVNALLVFAVPMLGIAVTYKGLNKKLPRAGAAYDWTSESFGKFFGFFSGWALLIATLVFIVSGSLTVGGNLMNIIDPAQANNLIATTILGAVAYLLIGTVLIAAAEEHCRAAACRWMDLTFVNVRQELPGYYRRHGYAENGTLPFPADQTPKMPVHLVRMSKAL